MDLGLKGLKVVFVGVSCGIGWVIVEVLVVEGCDVVVCVCGKEGVDDVVIFLVGKGVKVIGEVVDMVNGEVLIGWIILVVNDLGGCDIFILFVLVGGGLVNEEIWKVNFEFDVMGIWCGV